MSLVWRGVQRYTLAVTADDNKRAYKRKPIICPVRFWSEMMDFEAKAEVEGEVLDISTGGLFIRSEFLETQGTPVSLLVWLPEATQPVALSGRVAWVAENPPKGPGMGIELSASLDGRDVFH